MILILHTKRERTKTSAEVETNQDIHKNISYFFQEKNLEFRLRDPKSENLEMI